MWCHTVFYAAVTDPGLGGGRRFKCPASWLRNTPTSAPEGSRDGAVSSHDVSRGAQHSLCPPGSVVIALGPEYLPGPPGALHHLSMEDSLWNALTAPWEGGAHPCRVGLK